MSSRETKPCGSCNATGRIALSDIEAKVLDISRTCRDRGVAITSTEIRKRLRRALRGMAPTGVNNAFLELCRHGYMEQDGKMGRLKRYRVASPGTVTSKPETRSAP